jgi:membrane-associated phospholipid phosphatase
MDDLITFIAKYFILIPIFINFYIFIKLKKNQRWEMLALLFCTGVLSILLAKVGAHLYDNPRPYINDGTAPLFPHSGDSNGFPSDHTLLSAFLAFTALYYSRRTGIFLLVVAALVGWARVAAHVHHAIDILGSFIITASAYLITKKLLESKRVVNLLHTKHDTARKEKS